MKILLFDVDGTLCESGKIIPSKISNILNKIINSGVKIGIVGGGTYEKILYQLNNLVYPHYIFSECGSVFHILNNKTYVLISKNNIRLEPEYIKINILVKKALKFISEVDYLVSGNFIDLRNGLIYISLIGMSANDEERNNFINLDKNHGYRDQLINLLKNEAKKLGINEYLDICLGGSVGIAVYPKKWNKVQVLNWFNDNIEPLEIHYFGDKYLPGGNDYDIINNKRIIPHPINSPDETYDELLNMVK